MALPSSPPLLSDIDQTDLPTSPPLLPIASSSLGLPIGPSRKRQFSDFGASMSSDPLFSDSSQDADLEQPSRKRLVRGPWWHVRRQREKESMKNADSAVFMGSDESGESIDAVIANQRRMRGLAVADEPRSEETVVDAETYAARKIHDCLEAGREVVELSDLGLRHISNATLRPLHQLIRPPPDHYTPPSEDEFSPLTPSIQLYLGRNQLRALPAELFNLVNIAVLSLRNNELDAITPAISRLTNLKELNIAGNNIQYLPWEMLGLFHAGEDRPPIMTVRPNPLIQPCNLDGPSHLPSSTVAKAMAVATEWAEGRKTYEDVRQEAEHLCGGSLGIRGELGMRMCMVRAKRIQEVQRLGLPDLPPRFEEVGYLASSAVQYFDIDGKPLRRPGPDPSVPEKEDFAATMNDPKANQPIGANSASAPSLFELSLRRFQSCASTSDYRVILDDPGLPSRVAAAIQIAASNASGHGNEHCSTCGKVFVIARAEWMEYWFRGLSRQLALNGELVLPFLRRACSWACAKPSEVGEFRN
jgi:hypothetical protein